MRFNGFIITLLLAFACCFPTAAYRGLTRRTAALKRAYTAIREQVNGADVTLINDTLRVLFPHHLIFDFNQAAVRTDFLPVLERFGRVMQQHPETGILVIGHTDNIGSEPANLLLSRRRADSASSTLVRSGVGGERLAAWGLGADLPVTTNRTAEGRSFNRRVEFVVLYNYRHADLRK